MTGHTRTLPYGARLLAPACLAVALLSGCGGQGTTQVSGTGSTSAPPTSSSDEATDPGSRGGTDPGSGQRPDTASGVVAEAVTVTRSGGLAGDNETFQVTRNDPKAGDVLPLTDDPSVFAGLPRDPDTPCCDFYTYDVRIDYADGTDYRFATWQGADVPPEVEELVSAVTGVGRPPDPVPTK